MRPSLLPGLIASVTRNRNRGMTDDAWFVYEVTDHEIVLPTDVDVIAPVPDQPGVEPNGSYITLTSCHPRFSAAQRWIVHGELKYWAPAGHGVPAEMLEELS